MRWSCVTWRVTLSEVIRSPVPVSGTAVLLCETRSAPPQIIMLGAWQTTTSQQLSSSRHCSLSAFHKSRLSFEAGSFIARSGIPSSSRAPLWSSSFTSAWTRDVKCSCCLSSKITTLNPQLPEISRIDYAAPLLRAQLSHNERARKLCQAA
jgi:hypothetical protein